MSYNYLQHWLIEKRMGIFRSKLCIFLFYFRKSSTKDITRRFEEKVADKPVLQITDIYIYIVNNVM